MELTSNLRKYQRREYYRFSCALEMNSRKLEPEEVKAVDRNQLYLVPGLPAKRSVIVDISGGGLRFVGGGSKGDALASRVPKNSAVANPARRCGVQGGRGCTVWPTLGRWCAACA